MPDGDEIRQPRDRICGSRRHTSARIVGRCLGIQPAALLLWLLATAAVIAASLASTPAAAM